MLRSLEQERVKYAWECIQKVKGYVDLEDKYKSYVKKASTYIQINGLGNTLVFYRSKFEAAFRKYLDELKQKGVQDAEREAFQKLSEDEKAYKLLYDHLNGWFKQKIKQDEDILNWIISQNTSSIDVFQATKEIIALLNWMKRFAEVELRDKEEKK